MSTPSIPLSLFILNFSFNTSLPLRKCLSLILDMDTHIDPVTLSFSMCTPLHLVNLSCKTTLCPTCMGSKPYARYKKPCDKNKISHKGIKSPMLRIKYHTKGIKSPMLRIKKPMLRIKNLVLRSFGKILF